MKSSAIFKITVLSVLILTGCGKGVKLSKLALKNKLYYNADSKEPFTGKVYEDYLSGKDSLVAELDNGLFNKDFLVFYQTGAIKDSIVYEKGTIVKYKEFLQNGKVRNYAKKLLIESKEGVFLIKDQQNNSICFSGQTLDTVYLHNSSTFDKDKVYLDTLGLSLTCKGNICLVVDNYINGKLDGDKIIYYPNGKINDFSKYVKGKMDGRYYGCYDNGTLRHESFFKNGLHDGKSLSYYKNKQLKEIGNYKKDERDSIWNEYYENGKLKGTAHYSNGKDNGLFIDYYENGNVKLRGSFQNGLKDGDWTWYSSNGGVQSTGKYKQGKVLRKCDCCGKYYIYEEGWEARNPGFSSGAWEVFADGGAGGGPYCSRGCAIKCE
ncbi:MAG: toxin-antitoxin system YwqK family antitoxin [Paludibacter sp.]